jgi:putative hydrolase of the HAD superfamily
LIFDFGGVLMKTVDYAPRLAWDDRLGLPHGSVERVVHNSGTWRQAQTGQMLVEDYWQDVAATLKLDAADLTALRRDFYAGDRLDAALVDLLRGYRADGFQIALLSNDSSELDAKLQALGITDLFDPLVISAHIGVMKPDARAYEITLARLGRPAPETIFVDDMPANIAAASALGIHALRYVAGMDLDGALEPLLTDEP